MNISDEELVNLCLTGEGKYFEEIVKRYKKKIYSIAYRFTNSSDESYDITQEIFIKVYNSLKKYNPSYKFSSWILKMTTNYCVDIKRKNKIETTSLDLAINREETLSAENEFLNQEKKRKIYECINNLPNEYKILIELYHHQNLTYKEIEDILKIPMTKVKNRLYRARLMLKDSLKNSNEEGIIWSAD